MNRIVIIGGGPVGLAAAIALARSGRQVSLVERGMWPRAKPCGEGILPWGVEALHRLGITEAMLCRVGQKFAGITCFDANSSVSVCFRKGHGWGIPRTALSQLLFDEAKAIGVELLPHMRLVGMRRAMDTWELDLAAFESTDRQPSHRILTTPVVIGADGLHSTVVKLLGLNREPFGPGRIGYHGYSTQSVPKAMVEIHWQRGREVYLTPLPSKTGVAFLMPSREVLPRSELTAYMRKLWPGLELEVQSWSSHGPMGLMTKGSLPPGVFLIGDALFFADGITGEGISLGVHQALALQAELSGKALPCGNRLAQDMLRATQNYRIVTRSALLLSEHPKLRAAIFAASRALPGLLERSLELCYSD